MHILSAAREGPLRLLQSLVILVLAGLLIFYHTTMLVDFSNSHDPASGPLYNGIQGVLRAAIIVSLSLVLLGKRFALWMMWLSIGCLIATHYWAHFGPVTADFTVGRHPLSYLKGLIFPSIITTAFLYRR
ncbi:hypothetical protein [Qipengyuania gaetbuli]|uniref:hypothetical protein n=1 Tax=Qipengyuania gaetbuli TaxID=266952 RepID=UPI001CFC9B13|nr:hypothetical protein [Qipengyuania gaetbuli]